MSVQTLIDRKVYSVAADVQSTFGALSDVLNDIPSVDVSPDGVVSLRGSNNVLILVDGKPSAQFAGASAGDAIQSFPAKDVERIEVLTTPPPKFKAEGTAGVINIVTRKHRDRGVTGSGAASVGNVWRTVESANVNYGSDTLTTSATLGYRRIRKDRTLQSTLETQDAEETAGGSSSGPANVATTRETIFRTVPTARLNADYLPSDRDTLSGSVFWYERLRASPQRSAHCRGDRIRSLQRPAFPQLGNHAAVLGRLPDRHPGTHRVPRLRLLLRREPRNVAGAAIREMMSWRQ